MPYVLSILEMVLSCGAAALATMLSPESKMRKSKLIWIMLGAALLGAVCGYIIPERVSRWQDMLRMSVIVAVLSGVSYCDMHRRKIPNLFPLILTGALAVFTVIDLLTGSENTWAVLTGGLIGGGVMFLLLSVCRALSKGGIGFGDIKLLSATGLLLGLYGTFSVLFFGQLAAVLCAVVLMLAKKLTMKDSLPFGPFFYIGFTLTLLLGTC